MEPVYGVREPDPRNTVVRAPSREQAVDMLMPGDVVVVSTDGGRTWVVDHSTCCNCEGIDPETCLIYRPEENAR